MAKTAHPTAPRPPVRARKAPTSPSTAVHGALDKSGRSQRNLAKSGSTAIEVTAATDGAHHKNAGRRAGLVSAEGVIGTVKLPPSPHWYETPLPALEEETVPVITENHVTTQFAYAAQLIELEVAAYKESTTGGSAALGMSASDANFLSRILASGTLSDRLSALTLMVQASPLHNMRALEALKSMASKKSRAESLKAIRAITDWWIGGGAPSRKLKYFRDQPLTASAVTENHLMLWYFEDWLKKYFFSVLQLLEALSLDPLSYVRIQAMTLVAQLLREKPEQEANLLRLLVNKLGDPEKTVASKASFLILQLLQSHPAMKAIVIREISSLILRAPSSKSSKGVENQHAKYYGVITFNQTTLTVADKEIARHLMDVYFDLFRDILGHAAHDASSSTNARDDSLQRGAPQDAGRSRRTAKRKLSEALDGRGKGGEFADVEDDNSKMLSAILTGINRALPFAKLPQNILDEHVDLLFRITHSATFNISVQALVLISHVMAGNKTIMDRLYRTLYESLLDHRLVNSSKQTMYLNLLFRALKADYSSERVMAFVKRLLQMLTLHQPPFICGALYLLGELVDAKPDVRRLLKAPAASPAAEGNPSDANAAYDPRKRDPQYSQAGRSCLWEMVPFLAHFHPSVSLHTRQFMEEKQVTASTDLGLNTVMHFLDRFVYRNPKKPRSKGVSAMQPAAVVHGKGIVNQSKSFTTGDSTVNQHAFLSRRADQVPVDQVFFHQYFAQKLERQQAKSDKVSKRKKKSDKAEEIQGGLSDTGSEAGADQVDAKAEEASETSDGDEDEIWEAMKASMPQGADDLAEDDAESDEDEQTFSDSDGDSSVSSPLGAKDEDDASQASNPATETEDAAPFEDDETDLVDMDEDAPEILQRSKRKGQEGHSRTTKRRKLRQLPTFATYEDYAALIEAEPEDDL